MKNDYPEPNFSYSLHKVRVQCSLSRAGMILIDRQLLPYLVFPV
jgi:hypothetical protein